MVRQLSLGHDLSRASDQQLADRHRPGRDLPAAEYRRFPQGLGQCYFEFPATLGLGTVDIGQEFAQQQTLGRDKTVNTTPTPFDVDFDGFTDVAAFHLGGGVTIRNIAHGDWSSYNIATDFDSTNAPLVGQQDAQNSHFYSEELQALGKAGNLNWIVGAYYSDTRINDSQVLNQLNFPGNPLGLVLVHDIEPSTSSAIFGQATYDFSQWVQGLSLTAGYRYTWDRKSFTDQRLAPAAAAPPLALRLRHRLRAHHLRHPRRSDDLHAQPVGALERRQLQRQPELAGDAGSVALCRHAQGL